MVAQLQSSAGNRAVAELMTGDAGTGDAITPIDAISAAGNRAATRLFTAQRTTAQREDEKKPAAPKADPKADKAALRKAWADAGLVAGGPLFDAINADLSIESLVTMALPELVGLANEGAAADRSRSGAVP